MNSLDELISHVRLWRSSKTITEAYDLAAAADRFVETLDDPDEPVVRVIRELRRALLYYAKPDTGWDRIDHADAFEASRDIVPLSDDEREGGEHKS